MEIDRKTLGPDQITLIHAAYTRDDATAVKAIAQISDSEAIDDLTLHAPTVERRVAALKRSTNFGLLDNAAFMLNGRSKKEQDTATQRIVELVRRGTESTKKPK